MSKNNILTSPLGISLGVAVGAITIGLIGFGAYKITGNDTEEPQRTSDSEDSVRSSMFTVLDQRDSSMSNEEQYKPTQYKVTDEMLQNKGHTKVKFTGGKRSKKRRRNKSKKRNTLKK